MVRKDEGSKTSLGIKSLRGTYTEPTLDQQREYWEHWQLSRSESQWAQERTEVALELLRDLRLVRPNILDLGCGTGWFAEKLSVFGQVTGLDLNGPAMLEARGRWPHIDFIGGDLFEYPLSSNSFDVVVSMQVIAHVEDQASFIERVEKLLRPGGYLVLSTNNKLVMDSLGSADWGSDRAAGHIEKWLTVRDLKSLVSTRFKVIHTKTLLPMGDGGLLRVVNSVKLNAVLERLFPRGVIRRMKERLGLGYYIVLLAQKRPDTTG